MKEQSTSSFIRSAKITSIFVTLALLLGCDPGGGLPGAPKALRSGFVPVQQEQALGVCTSNVTIAATDGLPAPELENTGEWLEVWSDEFDGTEPDGTGVNTADWSFQTGTGCPDLCAWGNNELQFYNAANATVAEGLLTIRGDKPAFGPPFTSARMRTIGKQDFKYGRFEARIKVPVGKGLWPAFWLLPTDSPYGDSWAATGEIDIFETFNPGVPSEEWSYNKIDSTIWHGFVFPNQLSKGQPYSTDPTEWHTYAVEWEANELRFYVNSEATGNVDVHYQTLGADYFRSYYWGGDDTGYVKGSPGAPYDVDFHILLNLAIGGNGPATSPDGSNVWPADMLVDYVRVSKCFVDGVESETGGGCATNVSAEVQKPAPEDAFVAAFTLFDETVEDLVYCDGDTPLVRELRLAAMDDAGAVTMSEADALADADLHGTVLDISVDNPTDYVGISFEAADDGTFRLVGMGDRDNPTANAELKMDLYIDSANTDQAGKLSVLMTDTDAELEGAGEACAPDGVESKEFNISDLPQDEWTTLSVQLNELVDGLNVEQINSVFGLMVDSNAHIQVDNVQVVCGHPSFDSCEIMPPQSGSNFPDVLEVFIEDVDPIWTNGICAWDLTFGNNYCDGDTNNQVRWSTVATNEAGYDDALEAEFFDGSAVGVIFIQSESRIDLTEFELGKLVFDIRLVEGEVSPIPFIKIDCVDPCSSGARSLSGLVPGEWKTFTFTATDLAESGLDLTRVNTGLVLGRDPADGGATFQLDNIRWEKFGGEAPPPPPPEGSQPPTLPPVGSSVFYQDALVPEWELWDCCGAAVLAEVLATDPEHGAEYGMVTQISYGGPAGTVSGYSYGDAGDAGTVLNASGLAGGSLEFDALIVSQPDSCAPWNFKVESRNPTTAIELPLSAGHGGVEKPEGEWAHYSFPLDGLLGGFNSGGFKLFMAFPTWQQADGAVIQLDNVHISPSPDL